MRSRQCASRSAPTRNGTAKPMLIRPQGVPSLTKRSAHQQNRKCVSAAVDRQRGPEAGARRVPHQGESACGVERAEGDGAKRAGPAQDAAGVDPPQAERRQGQHRRQHGDVLEARRPAAEGVEADAVRAQRQPAGGLPAFVEQDQCCQQDAGGGECRPNQSDDVNRWVLAFAEPTPGRPDEQASDTDQEQGDPGQAAHVGEHPHDGPGGAAGQHAPSHHPPAALTDDGHRAGGDREQVAEQHRRVGRLGADDRRAGEAADEGEASDERCRAAATGRSRRPSAPPATPAIVWETMP